MSHTIRILISVLVFFFFTACEKGPDPRIDQLQKQVDRLADENRKLKNEMNALSEKVVKEEQAAAAPIEEKPAVEEMTLEKMKVGVAPLLKEAVRKLKVEIDTPSKKEQFGMRTEYHVDRAIYGLVRNDSVTTPYTARVIVSYDRYLESEKVSRVYATGTTLFQFGYQNGRWVLRNYEVN